MFVSPESFLPLRAKFVYHRKGRIMLGVISGYCRINSNGKSISVFHQNMTHETQLRRLPFGFPVELGFGISLRFVRSITPFFAMEINRWIAWISIILTFLLGIFLLETL